MPMKATDKVFSFRVPVDLYEFFKEQSVKNERSVNSEFLLAIKERKSKIEKDEKK